jgi:hypothetical protein
MAGYWVIVAEQNGVTVKTGWVAHDRQAAILRIEQVAGRVNSKSNLLWHNADRQGMAAEVWGRKHKRPVIVRAVWHE